MADLATAFLGLDLPSPVVVSSNPLCRSVDDIRRLEQAGAGAVVLPSLFEEQVLMQRHGCCDAAEGPNRLPPALRQLPNLSGYNRGADDYLMLIYEAKNAVDIPVIASLNGTSTGGWVDYARLLASAGADAVELNIYYLPTAVDSDGQEIEARFEHLVREVKAQVAVPLAVKLSPYFTAVPNVAARLARAGADGIVLFNRFYQPDFDIATRTITPSLTLSDSSELRLRLRWTAILYGHVDVDLAVTGGVHTAQDVIKGLMAGASTVMMASALLRHGPEHLRTVLDAVAGWIDASGEYGSVADLRGVMSYRNAAAPAALERANYIGELQSWGGA